MRRLEEIADRPLYVIGAALAVVALLHRLPFFVETDLNWDEATFLLMGADILAGHLPYTHLWDNKPPLAFVPFAFAAWISSTSLLGVRLLGLLLVALSACLFHRLATHVVSRGTALWSSLLFVLFASENPGSFAAMSEHVALPFLVLHLTWLLGPRTATRLLASGVALGCACLVRMNLAYVCIGASLALAVLDGRRALRTIPLLACGVLAPLTLLATIYATVGELDLLIHSVVTVPLAYATGGHGIITVARRMLGSGLRPGDVVLWTAFFPGVVVLARDAQTNPRLRKPYLALALILASIMLSILLSGHFFNHYLIQALPLLCLGAGAALARIATTPYRPLAFAALALPILTSLGQYVENAARLARTGTLLQSDIYETVRFLNARDVTGDYVFFANAHIGYWLTGAKIPTDLAHPSNLGKTPLLKALYGPDTTSAEAIHRILEKKPRFIVRKRPIGYLHKHPRARRTLNRAIKRHYQRAARFGDLFVYEQIVERGQNLF